MNKTSKIIIGIIVVIIIVGLIFVFGGEKKEEKETIKIGAIHALSGKNAVYGEAMKKGMDLAVKEFNVNGRIDGRKIKVLYQDHAASPQKAVEGLRALQLKGRKIISTSFSNVILALSPIAKKNEILLINSGATSKDIKKQGKFILSTIPDSVLEVEPIAKYAIEEGYNTAGIIYVNYQFGIDQKDIFKKEFEENGGEVLISEVAPIDSKDYRTNLAKIKEKNPDVIFIGTLAKDTSFIIKQAKELGVDVPLITTQTSVSKSSLEEIGKAAEGIIFSGPRFDVEKDQRDVFINFKNKYKKEYGEYPDYFATTYYDSTRMVLEGIKNCGSARSAKCVSNYLMNLKDFEGASGKTTFTGTTVKKPIDIKTFKNGKITTLEFK